MYVGDEIRFRIPLNAYVLAGSAREALNPDVKLEKDRPHLLDLCRQVPQEVLDLGQAIFCIWYFKH